MENVYIVGNLIWIRIDQNYTYGSKISHYVLCGRNGGIVLDAVLTKEELEQRWSNGRWLKGINVSDTVTYNDK